MHPKQFSYVIGVIMLVSGALAFIPALSSIPVEGLPALRVESSYGLFLGILPMNIFNKLILIAFGISGIWAASERFTALPTSISYSRVMFVVMAILAVMGFFSSTQTFYGYMPLWGADAVTHTLFAALGAYFGFMLTSKVKNFPDSPKRTHLHS